MRDNPLTAAVPVPGFSLLVQHVNQNQPTTTYLMLAFLSLPSNLQKFQGGAWHGKAPPGSIAATSWATEAQKMATGFSRTHTTKTGLAYRDLRKDRELLQMRTNNSMAKCVADLYIGSLSLFRLSRPSQLLANRTL